MAGTIQQTVGTVQHIIKADQETVKTKYQPRPQPKTEQNFPQRNINEWIKEHNNAAQATTTTSKEETINKVSESWKLMNEIRKLNQNCNIGKMHFPMFSKMDNNNVISREITVGHWSANGIRGHYSAFIQLLKDHRIDIMFINKTTVTPTSNFNVKGYEIVRKDRNNNEAQGRVLILVRESIIQIQLQFTIHFLLNLNKQLFK